ncbi:MAG: dipeptidase PepE [Alteromonadaceae bacterium]|nr:dipeptidase PepE [Alteromonadaceae bacterium]
MQLLLLSSSKVGDSGYLETAKESLLTHFANSQDILFVPYAGVTIGWDDYTKKVQDALPELNIKGLHQFEDVHTALTRADGIMVGGGNTFNLLKTLYDNKLVAPIRELVSSGMPYAGWSAGSNLAGMSIRTTNDMPIVEPVSFNALNLVPFQINPHYTDYQPPGHNGETRDDRLAEFMQANADMSVLGIPEGTGIMRQGLKLSLTGIKPAYLFKNGEKRLVELSEDLSYLLG